MKKNQVLKVTRAPLDCGMTGVEYLGASNVKFIEVAETHPKHGATFRCVCNGTEMKLSEKFFVADNDGE